MHEGYQPTKAGPKIPPEGGSSVTGLDDVYAQGRKDERAELLEWFRPRLQSIMASKWLDMNPCQMAAQLLAEMVRNWGAKFDE